MERIPESPPKIAPVTDGLHRPIWSVMIPAYNCSNYLKEAIVSVLKQDMGENLMQIEVVDDCSTDANVEELVRTIGEDRVSYYRQKENVGSLRNFETCINRSRGKYVHLLHGDDRVKKGYYLAVTEIFEKFPGAGAAFCPWEHIDSYGRFSHQSRLEADEPCILANWLYKLAQHPRLQYVAITVKREVYEKLGSFYLVQYGEDWEMWARIAKEYDTAYIPEFLAEYREHENSITWQSYQTGQNIKDIEKVTAIIISYLPKKDQRKMLQNAKRNYVYWAMNETFGTWFDNKNNKPAYNQIKSILGIYRDKYIISRIAVLLFYIWSDPYRNFLKKRLK
ncbi:glycosyltransferase family 2 protein [Gillisia limnaea]|uniref:Glycosyl transferase family 2 n=1 Tax=Gillisia limnaea (strain DSM 15749 / LMG 21470 / R-8282) TaxID=865937 RepID=H2BT38_GILLR|nr:glycosyltransferase [Gillisia limnaea]EHQ02596.1 glycosyl transferase family 2 [Gillisia limnaea DSM 15749]